MIILVSYLITGVGAGLLSGLLGVGGGIIVVPALVWIFTRQGFAGTEVVHLATATSLAAMIFTTFATTYAQQRRKAINWNLVKQFLPGTFVGAIVGIWAAKHLSGVSLRILFAFFAAVIGIKMIIHARRLSPQNKKELSYIVFFLMAMGIGIFSGLLGLGGGMLFVPLLLWLGLPMTNATGTSVACAFPMAITGACAASFISQQSSHSVPIGLVGAVYWPAACLVGLTSLFGAPLGVRLAHYLPVDTLKRIFGGFLVIISINMLPLKSLF